MVIKEQIGSHYSRLQSKVNHGADGRLLNNLVDRPSHNKADVLSTSKEFLVAGCGLRPGMRVLDAGCGLGGLALHLAEQYGVEVHGVSICAPHVEIATRLAREKGLHDLVMFHDMDFNHLKFEAESFDAVVSQDAFCYAVDVDHYIQSIHRVLKQGGKWRAIDAFRNPEVTTLQTPRVMHEIEWGWKTPALRDWIGLMQKLAERNYNNLISKDLTSTIMTAARGFIEEKLKFDLGMKLGFYESSENRHNNSLFNDQMGACAAFGEGLLEGSITYRLVGATKI